MKKAARFVPILLIWFIIVSGQTQPLTETPVEKGSVQFTFHECAGKFSIFLLENHLDRAIFARVERVDFWKEYKKANMELGVHFVERVPPDPAPKVIGVGPWDAPPPFRKIEAGASVRYAVQIPDNTADYRIRVPYMENGEVARRLDADFPAIVKNDMPLVTASWKNVFSPASPNRCQ